MKKPRVSDSPSVERRSEERIRLWEQRSLLVSVKLERGLVKRPVEVGNLGHVVTSAIPRHTSVEHRMYRGASRLSEGKAQPVLPSRVAAGVGDAGCQAVSAVLQLSALVLSVPLLCKQMAGGNPC